jgi:threonine/homoserine/homoserine lactone efflux protein
MEKFIIYFLTIYLWTLSPGPSMALIGRNSARFGIKITRFTIFGIITSMTFYTILSILGAGALIQAYPSGFKIFKIMGSIYISYIGIKIFLGAEKKQALTIEESTSPPPPSRNLYFQGLLTDIANPITFVGLTSIILGFMSTNDHILQKIIYLILTIIASFLYAYTFAFLFGNKVSRKFILPRLSIFEKIAGILIVIIGGLFLLHVFVNFSCIGRSCCIIIK